MSRQKNIHRNKSTTVNITGRFFLPVSKRIDYLKEQRLENDFGHTIGTDMFVGTYFSNVF